ncbi:uncharacterized protein MCAP_0005-like, partial [Mercenaria mercenaria]|uniref:uncharacterized protein MCAP_0005-like n=1 Tax=Mercenaria mercenaria TaxID=6596 RepID=UPI00234E5E55
MATAQLLQERNHLYRLQILIIDGGTTVTRNIIHQKSSDVPFNVILSLEKNAVNKLRARKVITNAQYNLLYPQEGNPSSITDIDLPLAICLLRNLKSFGLNTQYNWRVTPQQTDDSLEADLCRLRHIRNEITHRGYTTGIDKKKFQYKWNEVEQVLLRLNTSVPNPMPNLQQELNAYKNSPLDPEAEEKIKEEIKKNWIHLELQIMFENVKGKVKVIEENVDGVKGKVKEVTANVEEVNENVEKVKGHVEEVRGNVEEVKENVEEVKEKVEKVKGHVEEVRGNVEEVKENVEEVKEKVEKVKGHVEEVRGNVEEVKENVKEVKKSIAAAHKRIDEELKLRENTEASKKYEMPTIDRPHDGRLITLSRDVLNGLLYNCGAPRKGGFGEVYVSKTKVPGLDFRVAIKKVDYQEEQKDHLEKLRSASNVSSSKNF